MDMNQAFQITAETGVATMQRLADYELQLQEIRDHFNLERQAVQGASGQTTFQLVPSPASSPPESKK